MKLPADLVERLRRHYTGRPVCVTGGAGFIGGHLVDALVSLGATVAVIDDLSNSSLEHLAGLIELEPQRLRFVHGSILDDDAMADAMEDAQSVFHLAAMGSVPRSIQEPQRTWSVNSTGTVRALEAARKAWGASPPPGAAFVLAASSSAYGDDPALPKVEIQPVRPLSPYAGSKLASEAAVASWSSSYAVAGASLRFFNIFGPRQPADSAYAAVIAAFAKRLLAGEQPTIFGDGTQSRDFTPVASAVCAMLLAGASERPLRGEVMNIGTGKRTTLLELAAMMARLCGTPHLAPTFAAPRVGDVPHSLADYSRAAQLIGYRPIGSLEETLEETIAWYRRALTGADRG